MPGNVPCRDHRFWIPLVGLYSGLRLGEIECLEFEDIVDFHGRSAFWVHRGSSHGNKKVVKNRASVRKVPIHPSLIQAASRISSKGGGRSPRTAGFSRRSDTAAFSTRRCFTKRWASSSGRSASTACATTSRTRCGTLPTTLRHAIAYAIMIPFQA